MADAAALREKVQSANQQVFFDAVRRLMVDLHDAAPEGETGDTRRMLSETPGGSSPRFTATVTSGSDHGNFVETGTRAHTVVPVVAKVLRFQPKGGPVVFATKANIPAQEARPWFAPTLAKWSDYLADAARTFA